MASPNPPSDFTKTTSLLPLPNPNVSWSDADASHPGFLMSGIDDTAGLKAYFILLEAKPGHEDEVLQILQDINTGVDKEPLTGPWFGCRSSQTTFCIFEAFPHVEARHDHDAGPGGQNFFKRTEEVRDMLTHSAHIYRLDVMHGKFGTMLGKKIDSDG